MVASYTQLLSDRTKGSWIPLPTSSFRSRWTGQSHAWVDSGSPGLFAVGTGGENFADISSEEALEHAIANLRGAIEESGALVTHDPLPTVLADEGSWFSCCRTRRERHQVPKSWSSPSTHLVRQEWRQER